MPQRAPANTTKIINVARSEAQTKKFIRVHNKKNLRAYNIYLHIHQRHGMCACQEPQNQAKGRRKLVEHGTNSGKGPGDLRTLSPFSGRLSQDRTVNEGTPLFLRCLRAATIIPIAEDGLARSPSRSLFTSAFACPFTRLLLDTRQSLHSRHVSWDTSLRHA